jgi:hypothetical protein
VRNIEDMLAIPEILTVKVTKEITKISHFGKKKTESQQYIMRWPSPWNGFSGWHLSVLQWY